MAITEDELNDLVGRMILAMPARRYTGAEFRLALIRAYCASVRIEGLQPSDVPTILARDLGIVLRMACDGRDPCTCPACLKAAAEETAAESPTLSKTKKESSR